MENLALRQQLTALRRQVKRRAFFCSQFGMKCVMHGVTPLCETALGRVEIVGLGVPAVGDGHRLDPPGPGFAIHR